jgi:hypothetical protein
MEVFKKIAKKCVLGLLIFTVEVPCSACFFRDVDYIASYDCGKISVETYKSLQRNAAFQSVWLKIAEAAPKLAEQYRAALDAKSVGKAFGMRLNGQTVESMVAAVTRDDVYRFAAIGGLFDVLKLKGSKDTKDTKEMQDAISQMKKQLADIEKAEAEMREKQTDREAKKSAAEKRQLESWIACTENYAKREIIFDYYYGDNGKEKPSDGDFRKYFDDNYIKYHFCAFHYTADGEEGETKEAAQKRAEKFLKDAKTLGFEEAVVKEYDKLAAELDQETTQVTDEEKAQVFSPFRFVSKEELKIDPNLRAIKDAPLNEAILLDYGGRYFVVFERMGLNDEDFKQQKDWLLRDFKGDEFEERLLKYGKTLGFKFNSKALVECRPSNMDL